MEEKFSESSTNRTNLIATSTLIIMIGWAASIIFGLIRQRIIAGQFGTGYELDAFTAANVVPELIYTMLSGGALSFAFIPIYTEVLKKRDNKNANLLFSKVINLLFLVTAIACFIALIFAPFFVKSSWGVGANYPEEIQQLIINLMRLLLLSTVLFSISSIFTATLYSHQHFIIPALLPSMYSIGIILGAIFLVPRIGIYGLAWGAILGAFLHMLIQIPALIKFKVFWSPVFGIDSEVKKVAILMLPRILDLLMARASINWLNATLSSRLGEGRLAALDFAYRLMNMPWTLIGTAIGIAVFPTMAELAASKDIDAQKRALNGSLRAILTLAIPAAVGLFFLGRPIIQILFEGGQFTPESTNLVLYALRFYTLALISQSMLEVVVRAFASQQDTYTPLYVSIFTTLLNIGLAIWLTRPMAAGGIEHAGPALANGIAVLIESLIGLFILNHRWNGINAKQIVRDTLKAVFAAAIMGSIIEGINILLHPSDLILLIAGGSAGLIVYFIVAYLLGIKDILKVPLSLIKHLRKPNLLESK